MSGGYDPPRTVLPVPDECVAGPVAYDAKQEGATFRPIRQLRPPAGAPNVLIVMLDDVGFGAPSVFGGPVSTPAAERLAAGGLSYTRFHTTALCSPTRAALLTGRNHHRVGMGAIVEMATSAPGYNSLRPRSCATLAEVLRLNGYATAQVGKCHEIPAWETSQAGPFDRWPTGSGFDYFYGFIGGETDQYYPSLHEGTARVAPWGTPEQGYHLTEDLADKAIAWVREQKALVPDRPFFLYFAPGATHAPHQVPKEWADRYAGRFDHGWDIQRQRTLAGQQELGTVPAEAELTRRHDEIPAWDDMPEALKPVLIRQMENYAGFLEHTDHHVGRVIGAIEDLGLTDDTLIYYIIGDNGASAEGTLRGTFNEMICLNGLAELETPEFLASKLDDWGGPDSMPHYAVGWAHAMNAPYQWTKQVASHWGGTRIATIVHWPRGIRSGGQLRHQFHHVIDVAPTVLQAAGIPEPVVVHGTPQTPIEGVSMCYSFDDGDADDRRVTQYFEIFGNRGIYHKGWSAVTKHRTPWLTTGEAGVSFDEDAWELYHPEDWTQADDLSRQEPRVLAELQRLFLIEAARHNVLPLDDRGFERVLPEVSGRPTLITGNRQMFLPGMGALTGGLHIVNWRNRSWTLTAQTVIPEDGARGVLLSFGGRSGGWALYLSAGGVPTFCYNYFGLSRTHVRADSAVPGGSRQIRMEFSYDGGGLGKGGAVTLFMDGSRVGAGRVERTQPIGYGYEYTDVGRDALTTVTDDYPRGGDNAFTGGIEWIELATGDDSHDHMISPADYIRIALARQ
jgi:arylsulfatase A-like enzyme